MRLPPPATEGERLRALRETGLLERERVPALDEICRRARLHFGVPTAFVSLVDAERQCLKGSAGACFTGSPRSQAFCDHTIQDDEVFVVTDARADPRFASNPLVTGEPHIRFYAGAPLTYLEGIRLGALCLTDTRARPFSPGDRAELAAFADEVVSRIAALEFGHGPGTPDPGSGAPG